MIKRFTVALCVLLLAMCSFGCGKNAQTTAGNAAASRSRRCSRDA